MFISGNKDIEKFRMVRLVKYSITGITSGKVLDCMPLRLAVHKKYIQISYPFSFNFIYKFFQLT